MISKKALSMLSVFIVCAITVFTLTACTSRAADSSASDSNSGKEVEGALSQDASSTSLWDKGINTVTLDDAPLTEADFAQNKLTVLNVWATWCPPCVSELPHLQEVSEVFAGEGVQIVGVLADGVSGSGAPDTAVIASAKTLLTDAGATYTVILPDATLSTQLIEDMQYFPTTYFVNAEGKVVDMLTGARDAAKWEEAINEVLRSL